ncbi:MAG: asparagine synthase (glutamine-hydrolyzing) [Defluviitaleaceae bacterium]|nr:asparagine synthase (glutamine-hydrolyzing) [Defluviitaleaceae bacterium]
MCGICGFTGSEYNDENNLVIKKMSSKIKHRGPDGEGYYIDKNITLGFRRLSFLDLSQGADQPMFNEDKSLVIVFNGEIYNFLNLKEMLIKKGHTFNTTSDTEVILHLYEEYKEDLLSYLRGMFAFVIYDIKEKKIFAARDFFGIKPFYYTEIGGNFIFSSEIKAILEYPNFKKEVNNEALTNYLTFQCSVLEETFFKNVYKLLPGHYITIENINEIKKENIKIYKYFDIKFLEKDKNIDDFVKEIDEVIKDSIEHHKVSDVEIGSFLSSGVDSSLLAARFGGKKTFTVGFDYDNYNEIEYAKKLSKEKGLENYNKIITTDEYWKNISKIQYYMDEPLADPSAIALYFVSDIAKNYVKGVISGEGADEFFGGYNIYKEPLALRKIQIVPKTILVLIAKIFKKIPLHFKGKNYIIRASQSLNERFLGNAKIFTEEERNKILKTRGKIKISDITSPIYEKSKKYDQITQMQFLDIHLWLVSDILLKADKMSMAHSLEVRVPYLDKEVFNVARTIPSKFRVDKNNTKIAFRLSAKKYLPKEVAAKKKLGFPVPIKIWLKEDFYYKKIKTAFESEASKLFFNTKEILNLLEKHKNSKIDNSRKIWTIYVFLLWYEEYFIKE